MWPFKRNRVLHVDDVNSIELVLCALDEIGGVKKNSEWNVVGNVEINTFYYEVNGKKVTISVENISGIEIVGEIETIKNLERIIGK